MGYYVGLEASLKTTQVCMVDEDRNVIWRGSSDSQTQMISERLDRLGLRLTLVGLETGSLTPWLYHGLKQASLPVV